MGWSAAGSGDEVEGTSMVGEGCGEFVTNPEGCAVGGFEKGLSRETG